MTPGDQPLSTAAEAEPTRDPRPSSAQVVLAFATLYIVWGSTYLAIRLAVATWPPLLLGAVRFATAGTLLYAFQRLRGVPAPDRRGWSAAAVIGGLMLATGNGAVCWSEQWVPSGVTALIVSSVPLWVTILPWLARRGSAPRPLVLGGVAVGLAGVVVLLDVDVGRAHAGAPAGPGATWAPIVLVAASVAWSVGSLWSRRLPLPRAPFMATAAEMLTAAPMLLVAAAARGELRATSTAMLAPHALAAVGYLVVLGSIAGFGAYVWLLHNVSAARASTYAFVNPVIAVFLGWLIADEPIGARTYLATLLVVVSVAAVVWGTAGRPRRA